MIHVAEHHDEVLQHWRGEDRRGIALCHVDFHDDLRGLAVGRRRRKAYPIGTLARGRAPLDEGNFLAHAVLEGRLDRVRWVHGEPGGRAWDSGIVRYESDLLGWPRRLIHMLRGDGELPLVFEERSIEEWNGPAPGEGLSVDWDCFASILDDVEGIGDRVQQFLTRLGAVVPAETYVVYSPEYSHPSLERFLSLVDTLRSRFGQDVKWLAPELAHGRLHPRGVDPLPGRGPWIHAILLLRRWGIFL